MSYINKAVLNGQEVQLNALEGLQDAQGHNRFIGGNNTNATISGLTPTYSKWSLSGTHLMLVFVASLDGQVSLAQYGNICDIEIPEWVFNKIYTIDGGDNGTVSRAYFNYFSSTGSVKGDFQAYLYKSTTNSKFSILSVDNQTIGTAGSTNYIRIQFDLIIDND